MNSTILNFGLGHTNKVDSVIIHWPSGIQSVIKDINEINTFYVINEDGCTTKTYNLPSLQLCNGEAVEVSLPEGYDSYLWSNGLTEKTISIDETGWYSGTFEKDGCTNRSSYFEVTEDSMFNQMDILPFKDQIVCEGDVIKLFAAPGVSYEWSSGEKERIINIAESGIYKVTVNTNCDTYISDSVEIVFTEVNIPLVKNDTVMIGESAILEGDSETINWYQDKNDLEPIAKGINFITPKLDESHTYFAGDTDTGFGFNKALMNIVPLNNVGDSIYMENEFVTFEVLEELTINSVKVRTQFAGERRIVIIDSQGELTSFTIDLGVGVSTILLNYHFIPGQYKIGTDPQINQNNLGTDHPKFSYSKQYIDKDKQIDGFLILKDSELEVDLSPYFFNWDVSYGYYLCEPRIPVHAVVKIPVNTLDLVVNSVAYPNPTSGLLHIMTEMALPFAIEVFDVSGRKLNQIKSNNSETSIELPDASGMYFLKLTNARANSILKVYVIK
jgi:hypothetical protein